MDKAIDPDKSFKKSEDLSNQYIAFLQELSRNWNSAAGSEMLTPQLIRYICPRFHRCSTPLKVRILVSLLYIHPETLKEVSPQLASLLSRGETDRDDWVKKLSRLLQSYIVTGRLNIRDIDTEVAYRTIQYLDEHRRMTHCEYRLKPVQESTHIFNILKDTQPIALCPDFIPGSANSESLDNLWFEFLGIDGVNPSNMKPSATEFVCSNEFNKLTHAMQSEGLKVLVGELRCFNKKKKDYGMYQKLD